MANNNTCSIILIILLVIVTVLVFKLHNCFTFPELSIGYFVKINPKSSLKQIDHRTVYTLNTNNLNKNNQAEKILTESNYHYQTSSSQTKSQCQAFEPSAKFDCHPENFPTKEKCELRGCCWFGDPSRTKPENSLDKGDTQSPVDVPFCYYPKNYLGYYAVKRVETELGFQVLFERNTTSYYPKDSMKLVMDVRFEDRYRLHVKLFDPKSERYEVPEPHIPKPSKRASDPEYTVKTSSNGEPFYLTVTRRGDQGNKPVFDTRGAAPLIFTDQFLQLSSVLPANNVYGLAEHRSSLRLDVNWTRRTMWNRDHPPQEGVNLYGSHPAYMVLENGYQTSGFLLVNSNAMDVILQPLPAVTWRTIGGILDFHILLGQSPADIVHQYTALVGRPFLPPYWSLGLHICRFGYKSVADIMKVVDRVQAAGIPQDVQWTDADYMVGYRDFTTDTKRFGDQAGLARELHKRGMHYVVIVDPGISNSVTNETYNPYNLGMKMDIFIKNETGQPLVGKVWPGTTVFVDFNNPSAQEYWTTLVAGFHVKVPVDGLWIDMNELSSFVNGSMWGCPDTRWDNPPYVPGVLGGKLYTATICASAVQKLSRSYNLHNLYGYQETKVTYNALKNTRKKRPFVISRSTFLGQGHYGGHWTGDNNATFHDLYRSISAILTNGLLGIPMSGADICGFNGNTSYELCLRWYQLGAFYPFSRSHNDKQIKIDQDPGAFDSFFAASVRKVYTTRYMLLPYLYTLFFINHMQGDPVARPLFYEFPSDEKTYDLDAEFMWGPGLLIAPVLTEGARQVSVYLPGDMYTVWYSYETGERFEPGVSVEVSAPLDVINLFQRGGTILPLQEPALTTTLSRQTSFSLKAAVDVYGQAWGRLYWDDGDSLDTYELEAYTSLQFFLNESTLASGVDKKGYQSDMLLESITIYGVAKQPDAVIMNNVTQHYQYDRHLMVLTVPTLSPKVNLLTPFMMKFK